MGLGEGLVDRMLFSGLRELTFLVSHLQLSQRKQQGLSCVPPGFREGHHLSLPAPWTPESPRALPCSICVLILACCLQPLGAGESQSRVFVAPERLLASDGLSSLSLCMEKVADGLPHESSSPLRAHSPRVQGAAPRRTW